MNIFAAWLTGRITRVHTTTCLKSQAVRTLQGNFHLEANSGRRAAGLLRLLSHANLWPGSFGDRLQHSACQRVAIGRACVTLCVCVGLALMWARLPFGASLLLPLGLVHG